MASESIQQTVTELLHQQHEEVKGMFDQLSLAVGQARVELFDCLRATLAVHETAEEIVVHPAARKAGGDAGEIVDARLREEDQAKESLAELERIGPGGDGFDARLAAFHQALLSHAEAEEHQLFPLVEKACDPDELTRMAERLRTAEELAPTHAHPHGPQSAVGNVLVGPFVGMVDKVRDKLRR